MELELLGKPRGAGRCLTFLEPFSASSFRLQASGFIFPWARLRTVVPYSCRPYPLKISIQSPRSIPHPFAHKALHEADCWRLSHQYQHQYHCHCHCHYHHRHRYHLCLPVYLRASASFSALPAFSTPYSTTILYQYSMTPSNTRLGVSASISKAKVQSLFITVGCTCTTACLTNRCFSS